MVSRERWAVTAVFGVNGTVIAAMVVRTPSLKLEHGLADSGVGLMSALFGVAALATMRLAGRIAGRAGSAAVLRPAAVALPLALVAVGVADGTVALAAAMAVVGAVNGAVDVAVNAHAVAVERALRRPVLNGCHAAWSIGALAGSAAGGVAAEAGASLVLHYALLAAVLVPALLLVGRWLLPASADRSPVGAGERRGARGGWSGRLVVLGVMGTTVLMCEAGAVTWSGVLLHDHHGASLGVAALGFVAFAACQTVGRLVGDRLVAHVPAHVLVRTGTATAAAGLALALAAPWPPLAVAGFAVLGAGLATPLPVLFGVVGRLGDTSGGDAAAVNVSRFTTMTYAGILLGPAAIGRLSDVAGLGWTLAFLVPALVAVSAAAGRVIPAPTATPLGGDGRRVPGLTP